MKIADVIKYEGDNDTIIWKHPSEDFNVFSQLIVHESQEAIFFRDGQALDLFGPGRFTLETQNLPFLNRLVNIPTNGVSPFHCEVYYINKVVQLPVAWGTDSKVQYMDPTYGFPLQIGAGGEMVLRVEDSRRLLVKLVGTEAVLGREKFVSFFRAFINARVKPYLADVMGKGAISIFDADAHMGELSNALGSMLIADFADYGVALDRFMVTRIVKPDEDPNFRRLQDLFARQYADIREAQIRQQVGVIEQETEAKRKVIDAQANAEKRRVEGYDYQQERSFDVAEKVAGNEGVGEFANMGIGMGMVSGIGSTLGGAVAGMTGGALGAMPVVAPTAGYAPAAGNAAAAGNAPAAPAASVGGDMDAFKTRVAKLKMMQEEGLLTDEEFAEQKRKLIDSI